MSSRPAVITLENFSHHDWTVVQLRTFARALQISPAGRKSELFWKIQTRLGLAPIPQVPAPVPQALTQVPAPTPQVLAPQVPTPVSVPISRVPAPTSQAQDPCHEYSQKHLFDEIKLLHRRLIHQIVSSTQIELMTERHLLYIFQLYDRLFLQDRIAQFFHEHPEQQLRFKFGKGTSSAGCCKHQKQDGITMHTISISRPVMLRACSKNSTELVNGLQAQDRLECLLLTFEHELVHLMLYLWRSSGQPREVHGPLFKTIARNLFGHTSFYHNIGLDPQPDLDPIRAYLRPGIQITARDKDRLVPYQVVRVNPRGNAKTCLARNLNDQKNYRVPLALIVLPS